MATTDTDTTTDETVDESQTETEERLLPELPPALQNHENWTEEINPVDLQPDNVRPINVEHVTELQEAYRQRGGFDDLIETAQFKDGDKTTYRILDGHHRHAAIVGNKELGITGLVEEEDFVDEFKTIPVRVYDGSIFQDEQQFLETQLLRTMGRRNIDPQNAADQAAAVFRLSSEGLSQERISQLTNKSRAWVSLHIRAHKNAANELKEAVRQGLISGKTLVESSMLKAGDQKKMLKKILKEVEDKTPKEAQKAERSVVDDFIAKSKEDEGKKPRWPKPIGRKDFGSAAHDAYIQMESLMQEAGDDVKDFDIATTRDEIMARKGFLQGLLFVYGTDKASEPEYSITAIVRAFKRLTGVSITDPDTWD